MKSIYKICILLLALNLANAHATRAEPGIAKVGRDIREKYNSSIVTVKTAMKQTMGGRTGESRSENGGVVVNAEGLTVISLSAIDPSLLLKQMYAGRIPAGTDLSAEVTDIKIVLADQSEVSAEVVIRDPDLDIAVIRPTAKLSTPVTPVDISGNAKPDLLDEVIVAKRLDQKADNALGLSVVHIGAVVKKPRLFYVLGETTPMSGLGSPVFTADGVFLGVIVVRTGVSDDSINRAPLGIVIPAANIRDNVEQAKEAPPTKKTEKPAE